METVDWSDCPLVETIPGKVSAAPLLKGTRLPVDAITGNYDAFLDECLTPDPAIAETRSAASVLRQQHRFASLQRSLRSLLPSACYAIRLVFVIQPEHLYTGSKRTWPG